MTKVKQVAEHSWLLTGNDHTGLLVYHPSGNWSLIQNKKKWVFENQDVMNKFLCFDPFDHQSLNNSSFVVSDVRGYVKGYPTNRKDPQPVDISSDLPLFAKRKNTNVVFCAGYYAVKSKHSWRSVFCPKLSTLSNKKWHGPFLTQSELAEFLKNKHNDST